MKDAQDLLNELLGDDILAEVSHLVLLRSKAECDIHIYHILNGPKTGMYRAVPKLSWLPAHAEFVGHGRTDQDALRDCLTKSRGIPIDAMFPRPGPQMVADTKDVLRGLM
jgi:hypothetical protein